MADGTTGTTVEDGMAIIIPHEGQYTSGYPGLPGADKDMEARLCSILGVRPGELRTLCEVNRRLQQRCSSLEALVKAQCCPANKLFGRTTIDEVSTESQVDLDNIVQNFAAGYINALPLAPGQKIRLQQSARPGYIPRKIQVDLNLANNGTNYSDIRIRFYVGPGGTTKGKAVGPNWRGNQFLNKNGTQIIQEFPEWRACEIEVGSAELLAVEVEHVGNSNNLDSLFITVGYDNSVFYKLCETECG